MNDLQDIAVVTTTILTMIALALLIAGYTVHNLEMFYLGLLFVVLEAIPVNWVSTNKK